MFLFIYARVNLTKCKAHFLCVNCFLSESRAPSIDMTVLYHRPKTGFSGAITQMLTDLDEIWQVVRITEYTCKFNFNPISAWVAPGQTLRSSFL